MRYNQAVITRKSNKKSRKSKKRLNKTFKLSRVIHIYLSSALFALMIFFSITGFTLNHAHWFSSNSNQTLFNTPLPKDFGFDFANPKVDQLTRYLKNQYTLDNVRSVDIDPIDQLISLDYPLPNGYAFASFDFAQHQLEVEYQLGSGIGLLNDLHKGRHTGEVWSWLIDACAWLFCFFSITGFILIFQNKKYRRDSVIASIAGTFTPIIMFILCVPTFSY